MTTQSGGDSTRREFLKHTGRFAAATTLVSAATPWVHASEDNTIRVALVGCGGRGNGAAADAPGATATTLVEVERQHILSMLKRTGGVIEGPKGAAKMPDMKPSTMRYRIRKLGIRKLDYIS